MNANTITLFALAIVSATILDLALIRYWQEYRTKVITGSEGKINLRAYVRETIHWAWFFIPLLLAALPTWFVFFDRWRRDPLLYRTIFHYWHVWRFKDFFTYPYYFLLVFTSTVLLVGIGFSQKNQFSRFLSELVINNSPPQTHSEPTQLSRFQLNTSYCLLVICSVIFFRSIFQFTQYKKLPGLEYAVLCLLFALAFLLQEIPIASLYSYLRKKSDLWLSASLAHVSIVVLLASTYSKTPGLGWGITIVVLTHVNLIRHIKKLNPVFWIITLALIIYTLGINAWWFSVIGDEYVFYRNAVWVVNHLSEIQSYLFSGESVYGTHPHLSSVLQAIPLFFFGSTNFSWRLSSLYLAAISIAFFYDFFQRFLSRKAATLIVMFLAGSHYIMTFGKIGYNNLQALFALSFILWAAGWALQSNHTFAYVLVGMAQGFCFYVFPAALYAVPLPFILFLLYKRPFRQQIFQWGAMLGALVITIFPLFLQPEYWNSKLEGTLLRQPQLLETFGFTFSYLARNIVYAFFSPIYALSELHFVAVSLIDPISGAFLIFGTAFLIWGFGHHTFVRFLLFSFGYMLFIVGASHGVAVPPSTRMFLLLPWWFSSAAIGLIWFEEWLKRFGFNKKILKGVIPTILAVILIANLYQAFPVSYRRMSIYHQFQTYFTKLSQPLFTSSMGTQVSIIIITPPSHQYLSSLYEMLDLYQIPYKSYQLAQAFDLESFSLDLVKNIDTLIIISPQLDVKLHADYDLLLESSGKNRCSIANVSGRFVFDLWHSDKMSWVCEYLRVPPFD